MIRTILHHLKRKQVCLKTFCGIFKKLLMEIYLLIVRFMILFWVTTRKG